MGGTSMVSRNGRKENIRQNGSHPNHSGRGASARRGFDQWRAARNPARAAAGHGVGASIEYSAGAVGLVLESGDREALRRPHPSANSSPLADSVTKNLFISGTPGVGKTTLLREVTLGKRERIGGFYTEHILSG